MSLRRQGKDDGVVINFSSIKAKFVFVDMALTIGLFSVILLDRVSDHEKLNYGLLI